LYRLLLLALSVSLVSVALLSHALLAQSPVAKSSAESSSASDSRQNPEKLEQQVVVTGTYQSINLEEAERPIRVIPVDRKALLTTNTWIDLLRLDSSLDVRQRGANSMQADFSIRGGSFGQTLVLVDGLRMNDSQTGHHNSDLPIPLDSVARIEILPGAGSAHYGADAVGGVINVITRRPESSFMRLRGGLGNFGTNQQRAEFGHTRGEFYQQVSLSRELSTGFIANRDYRYLGGAYQAGIRTRWGNSSVLLASSDRVFGAQGFYGNFPSWERTKSWWVSGRQEFGSRTEASFAYRRHTDLFVLFRDNPLRYTNHHIKNAVQAALRRRDPIGDKFQVSYGVEGFNDDIVSNNLGNRSRARGAAYAVVDARALRRFSVSFGARQEIYSGGQRAFSPLASAAFWASSKIKIRGNASRAFRLPTFTDLYYRDPANIGNPNLRSERAANYEGGVDLYLTERVRVETTVFRRNERDVIDFVRSDLTSPWRAINFQQLNFTGLETALLWRHKTGQFDLRYTALEGGRQEVAGTFSRYAFNYPRHHAVVGWQTTVKRQVLMRTRIGRLARLGRDAYTTWDLYAARAGGTITPFLQFTNLSNARFQEIVGVPMPGRGVVFGLEWMPFGRR
jgi:iron complex outermembrane recepter protein